LKPGTPEYYANLDEQVEADNAVNAKEPKLAKLVGTEQTKAEGNFVLQGQQLATKEGFRNVSKIWYTQTISYEDGLQRIANEKAKREDILCTVKNMVPAVEGDTFGFRYVDGRFFRPTEHAITHIGGKADTGTWFPMNLLRPATDVKGKQLYARDRGDAETLAYAIANGFRRLDQSKKFLFRTYTDGTLRAMLTERYAIVDNEWFIDVLRKLIPGGRLSHWQGDADTIYGNILIPDTIREEKDSDYGGMLSLSNCEIGTRRIDAVPSIFRAICMNGCIWGQTKGEGLSKVHRGKIDLDEFEFKIRKHLNKQIPLLPQGIDKLLATRTVGWDGASAKVVIAQLAKDNKLAKGEATAVLLGYHEERTLTPEYAQTLFGVTNAVTRAAQKLGSPAGWVKFDELGGRLATMKPADFDTLVSKAKHLKTEEVEDVYATIA
jgi:hypothetical protein